MCYNSKKKTKRRPHRRWKWTWKSFVPISQGAKAGESCRSISLCSLMVPSNPSWITLIFIVGVIPRVGFDRDMSSWLMWMSLEDYFWMWLGSVGGPSRSNLWDSSQHQTLVRDRWILRLRLCLLYRALETCHEESDVGTLFPSCLFRNQLPPVKKKKR